MKNSSVHLVQLLRAKLIEFPVLVDGLEKKEFSFLENLLSWIKQTEQILTDNRLSGAAELSGLRSRILAPGFAGERNASIKKMKIRAASEVLYDLQSAVARAMHPFEVKVEEARELIRQLLAIVAQTGAIVFDGSRPFEMLINDVWRFINSNEQLRAGAVKLKSSLSQTDIQLLIAEEINTEDFMPPPLK